MQYFRVFRYILLSALALFAGNSVFAGSPGSTSAAFLKLPSGARAIGMGETYVAAGDDVQALSWNPAGLARMSRRQFTFMHSEWMQGIRYESAAYAQSIGGFIFVGGGVDFLDGGKMDRTTFNNMQGLVDGPENYAITTNGVFSVTNVVLTAAGAVDVSGLHWLAIPNVQAGMNIRVLMEKIDKASAANAVVDFGALWSPEKLPDLTVAFVGQNMGPALHGQIPPISFRLGGAYRLFDRALTTAMDLYFPVDNYPRLSVGAEYWYKNMVCVRSGYRFQGKIDLNDLGTGGLEGLSLGAGFRYQIVQVDYAFATLGFLGASHRVSLTVNL